MTSNILSKVWYKIRRISSLFASKATFGELNEIYVMKKRAWPPCSTKLVLTPKCAHILSHMELLQFEKGKYIKTFSSNYV